MRCLYGYEGFRGYASGWSSEGRLTARRPCFWSAQGLLLNFPRAAANASFISTPPLPTSVYRSHRGRWHRQPEIYGKNDKVPSAKRYYLVRIVAVSRKSLRPCRAPHRPCSIYDYRKQRISGNASWARGGLSVSKGVWCTFFLPGQNNCRPHNRYLL